VPITDANRHLLRSDYEARTPDELPVLVRWFEGLEPPVAEYLIVILYDRAPLWFFTSSETDLGRHLDASPGVDAIASFAAKDHALFAMLTGRLVAYNDRAVIDRLWNPFIAAWFTGKDDPKLRLLRMDATEAHVWLNENSMLAGIKLLLGSDPKKDYKDKAGDVDLR
jgi:general stress protein 26